MKIERFTCENLEEGCVTDRSNPRFSYWISSKKNGAAVEEAKITVGESTFDATSQTDVPYSGEPLKPFTRYEARLTVRDNHGETDEKKIEFTTGRMGEDWDAEWITDGTYSFKEKKVSPVPLTFRKIIRFDKPVDRAEIYCTALGTFKININGEDIGNDYFAPGFTSYKTTLQYRVYDVTDKMTGENDVIVNVAGGWAVGSFVFTRKNRITAKRQALLFELRVTYADGSVGVVGTDESWDVARDGRYKAADIYDGETYDATVEYGAMSWHKVAREKLSIAPQIVAERGAPVCPHERFKPVSCVESKNGGYIYDFGQNLAGVVCLKIKRADAGQRVTVRHAEILKKDGELNTAFLRSAKCTLEYVCREGEQEYMPTFTYMGYRYVHVTGISPDDFRIESVALYSDLRKTGSFTCSNEMINRLQKNIVWSGKSNLMDIPTDCPQRDERMGWTGDIALFSSTACYNFDMSRFFDKWLRDVKSEQHRGGGIPNTVPVQGYGFPATMPVKAIAFWGDACIYVPYAEYMSTGNKEILEEMYPVMKKYLKACRFWAGLISVGRKRYIWSDIPALQFGDWVAPDVPKMGQWQARSKWTATACFAGSCGYMSRIAHALGRTEDEKYYSDLFEKISDAYIKVFTDGEGRLREEFQSAYVLPLHFKMFPEDMRKKSVGHFTKLIEKNGYRIGTGFPGTPYILFSLADNGAADVAFKMLTNTECPSWLYEVKAGATTIWERWDALNEDGTCSIGDDGTGGMISFNHYSFGAVGDFLYRRIAGIECVDPGYKSFVIAPLVGGGLTSARGEHECPYGKIVSDWTVTDGIFTLNVEIPAGTRCRVLMPDGSEHGVESGKYTFSCKSAA